jgi:uncharacterized protein YvpB
LIAALFFVPFYFGAAGVEEYINRSVSSTPIGPETFQVEPPEPSSEGSVQFTAVNSDTATGYFAITAQIEAEAIPVTKVSVAVWGEENGQNDLRWIDADIVGENIWGVSDDVRKHNYETGTYIAHVYATDANGERSFAGACTQTGIVYTGPYMLSVPMVNQLPSYPSYCEAASITMLISHAVGYETPMSQVVGFMPLSSISPDLGWGRFEDATGWTIYPSATVPMLSPYGLETIDLSGASLDVIKATVRSGKPVAVWLIDALGPGSTHCVVVTGYDSSGNIYYNDPYGARYREISESTFNYWWVRHGSKAMTYA